MDPNIHIVKYKLKNGGGKWRDLLTNFNDDVFNVLRNQLLQDKSALENGDPVSDCAYNFPRLYTKIDRNTGISHKMAKELFPLNEDKPEKVKNIYSYVKFSQFISLLTKRFKEQLKNDYAIKNQFRQVRLNGQRCLWPRLKNKPVSDLVVNPVPMPVDIAKEEDLKPFFEHMEKGGAIENGDHIEFIRGVHYNDMRIDLCKQVVGHLWIQKLMDSIKENENVKHFLLGNNIIDYEGAKAISNFIREEHKPQIKTWYLAGNRINSEGIKLIAEALEGDKDANALWLKRNPLKPEGMKWIGQLLKHNTGIKILDLHNTGILDDGMPELVDGLMCNRTLRFLYLDANGISIKGIIPLANYFRCLVQKGERGVTSLWLDMNRLDDDGVIELMDGLKDYKHLKRLVIGSNRISSFGAKVVFDTLKHHPNLIMLDLGFYKSTSDMGELPNNISDEGAEYAAQFIRENKTVKIFSILQNNISLDGLKKIYDAFQENNTMLYIYDAQYGLEVPQDVHRKFKDKMEENIKANLGMTYQEFISDKMRDMKHSKKIRNIDSIYRNKM